MPSFDPPSKTDQRIPLTFGGREYHCSRPHRFGLVIHGPASSDDNETGSTSDYLHDHLLADPNRESFLQLVEDERLVVCKNVASNDPTYRRVRGKSSSQKLSQAEYYHHDGCSCPTKPRLVEIRLPEQAIGREIATAIAPFANVVAAMLTTLPDHFKSERNLDQSIQQALVDFAKPKTEWPSADSWDRIQGKVTRLIRKEFDAEACRAFFRQVDSLADAYVLPWEMGESRLMLNNHADLSITMQHRRAMQRAKSDSDQNGSLVKRWTAEEYPAKIESACEIVSSATAKQAQAQAGLANLKTESVYEGK